MEYFNGRLRYNEFIEIRSNDIIYKIDIYLLYFNFVLPNKFFYLVLLS